MHRRSARHRGTSGSESRPLWRLRTAAAPRWTVPGRARAAEPTPLHPCQQSASRWVPDPGYCSPHLRSPRPRCCYRRRRSSRPGAPPKQPASTPPRASRARRHMRGARTNAPAGAEPATAWRNSERNWQKSAGRSSYPRCAASPTDWLKLMEPSAPSGQMAPGPVNRRCAIMPPAEGGATAQRNRLNRRSQTVAACPCRCLASPAIRPRSTRTGCTSRR